MRSVIGSNDVNGAVCQAGSNGVNVSVGPQRRVDLEPSVVVEGALLSKEQMMWSHLCRDSNATGLGGPNDFHRTRCRQVADVKSGACLFSEEYVTGNDDFLRDSGPSREAEPRRH
jgi:hypothetical protein